MRGNPIQVNPEMVETAPTVVRDAQGRVISGVLNPNGRPRRSSFTEKLHAMLTENISLTEVTPSDLADAIAKSLVEIALDKHQPARDRVAAATYIGNRIDGTPRQSVDVSGDGAITTVILNLRDPERPEK